MAESAEEIYRRAQEAADSDGRLAMPPVSEWDTFPFEGDIRVRPLEPPAPEEPPRLGEDPSDCWRCTRGDEGALWSNERWRLVSLAEPSGLPVIVILESRPHLDIGDLSDEQATSFAAIWDDILPPTPEHVWRDNLATVARALAETGGELLV